MPYTFTQMPERENSLVALQTLYIPRKHKLAFHLKNVHQSFRFLVISKPSLSLQFFCSSLTDYQAQRKVLNIQPGYSSFFQASSPGTLSLGLFGKRSSFLPSTELLLLSRNPSHPTRSHVPFSTKLLHQASSSLSTFGASMSLHSSSSFAPPSLLHTHTQKMFHVQPCSRHGENIRRQDQDG